ncbi:MAG: sigma-70 family RNA polymerase sigma factor [Planctomycetota bacterium]
MSLSDIDRILLHRCIEGAPRAWQDFVDRFLGLVVHVANHTAQTRGIQLDESTRDDLIADVFLTLLANDKGVLRRFRRNCSLATYLTVIARRVIARRLHQSVSGASIAASEPTVEAPSRMEDREEVERLMNRLDPEEANVVRMYHLEGKSYREISDAVGMTENSIGPLLSRARQKMREGA